MSKLITLSQLKSGLQGTKSYIDTQDAALGARIDGVITNLENLEATGGDYLKGFSVNGEALNIANQIAELLIATGDENGTINVNGAAIAIKGLADLAFKNKISESDFDDALLTSFAALATDADLSALTVRVETAEGKITTIEGDVDNLEAAVQAIQDAGYQTATQVEAIAKAAVAASGHAKFVEAESDPAAEGFDAESDVMYLWPAEDGDGYSIYAKVGNGVKLLGHTKVKLTDYSTTEQMQVAIAAAVADKAAAADLADAVERIAAVEALFASYYTKDEAEAKFTDEAEAQTIAENAATAAETAAKAYTDEQLAGAKATDAEVESMLDEVFPQA